MNTTAKKSFILYSDIHDILQVLSDEEAGKLFKAIASYNLTGEKAETDNRVVNVILTIVTAQLERNKQKYQQICTQRSSAGRKGSEKRWKKQETKPEEQKTVKETSTEAGTETAPETAPETTLKTTPSQRREERITKSKEHFIKDMEAYADKYDRQMLNDFFRYWTELNPSHTKMRYEMQKTWETGKRLATWSKKSYNQP